MLSKTEREKIRARAEKATPGPWYPHATNDATCAGAEYVGLDKGVWPLHDGKMGLATYGDPEQYDADRVIAITCHQRQPAVTASLESDDPNEGNTEFIAHARTDIPALLDTCDALERAAARLGETKVAFDQVAAIVLGKADGERFTYETDAVITRVAGTEAKLKHAEQRENIALMRAEKAEADLKHLTSIANSDATNTGEVLAHNGLTEEFGMMGCDVLDQVCDALLGARADVARLLYLLEKIIGSLPEKRDWLAPDVERAVRVGILKSAAVKKLRAENAGGAQ